MGNIIVKEPAADIRKIARNSLQGFWKNVFIGTFLYIILVDVLPEFLTLVSPDFMIAEVEDMKVSMLANLYVIFTRGAFAVGISSFMLMFFRKKDANPGYLFNGFGFFFKAFGLTFMVGIFTFLWSLLFVVPGIIAAFRYSQVFFILADDPSKGIMQCINESKAMMNGNKANLFFLMLSFIGWAVLVNLAGLLLTSIFNESMAIVAAVLCAVPTAFYSAYFNTAQTAFYELASGHLRAQSEIPDIIV